MIKPNSNRQADIDKRRRDKNSLLLLSLLTIPAFINALVLLLKTNDILVAEIPHTAFGLLGSFAAITLSVFITARYKDKKGIEYVSAGLLAIGIIGGFQSVTTPSQATYIWFHTFASIFCSAYFSAYAISLHSERRNFYLAKLPIFTICSAIVFGIVSLIIGERLPSLTSETGFTTLLWMINAVSIALYLFSGISIFIRYRNTGNNELYLFTGIIIFLFHISQTFYFVQVWSPLWWFWLILRLAIYATVLTYILREYIQTGYSLKNEIKERIRTEAALSDSNKNWADSFNSIEEAMYTVTADYNILNANHAGIHFSGLTAEELIGAKCYRALYKLEAPCSECPFRLTMELKQAATLPRSNQLTGRHYNLKTTPIFSSNGQIEKFVYLVSDITERVNSEEKERLLQQELSLRSRLASIGEVVAGVTHEINNPLTSVIAFVQMLEKLNVPEEMKEAVEVINDSAIRIADIVGKLRSFSRKQRAEKELADINSVITAVIQMRSYELRNHKIDVITNFSNKLPKTYLNIGQIQQVVLNLVVNAEQAISGTNKNGVIIINTSEQKDAIRLTVSDNGPGISPQNMEKLFNPFFTTKDSNGGPGLGLGLSISYGIIKEHNGQIFATSSPGNGATFTIELPILTQTDQPNTKDEDIEAECGGDMNKANILVIDDEVNIRRAVERVLTGEGHEVTTTASALTGLGMVRDRKFDLILLDLRIPGMDGIAFYEHLMEIDPKLKDIILCMTGDIISVRSKEFLETSELPFLTKPFGVDELMEHISQKLKEIALNA